MMAEGLSRGAWEDVIASLEEFLPYYERVNRASTLFRLPSWRAQAARRAAASEVALEIGPGPGGFAQHLRCARVYLLDPSPTILRYSATRLAGTRYIPVVGQAEAIPLRDASVDRAFCIFSFRDFLDKERSLREVLRVLRPGGELHILDLFRGEGAWERRLMELWLARGGGLIVRLLVPRHVRRRWRHDPYRQLLRTYRIVGTAAEYEELMREVGFQDVEARELAPGSIQLLQGARTSTT